MFTGAYTALVTPFKDGKLDEGALEALVEFQIKGGIDGLVPCGTTGESATLSYEEHKRVIDLTIEVAAKRVPVIAGSGSNSTEETVMLTRYAEKAGANAALLICPYYNKPGQRGVYEHYKTVASQTNIPLIVYNVPSRTGLNMLPRTVAALSEIKNIVGIKEASGDLGQVSEIIERSKKGFCVLSGDDFTTLPLLSIGGHGVISVTSNLVPRDVAALCSSYLSRDLQKARKLHHKLGQLNRAMFVETNPVPIKTALSMMGMMEEEFRLPLVRMEGVNRETVEEALKGLGLIQ